MPRRERRAVFERDGLQCTYVGPDGRRCTAKAFLQIDHVAERARGGIGESENLRELADKLVRGLTGLGFTRARADATVKALCAGRGPVPWSSPIEVLLRAAVQMASP